MSDKKVTDLMLERIKYLVNAIENGEYEPIGYKFTVSFQLPAGRNHSEMQQVTFSDDCLKLA